MLADSPLTRPAQQQASCRTFRLLAREILSHPQGLPWAARSRGHDPPAAAASSVNPALARDFAPLFSSAACFTPAERGRSPWFLSLNGDVARPFRRLPWAAPRRCGDGDGSAAPRDAYLRPGASWRDLSVTFARGPPITRLEVVKSYSSEDLNEDGRDHVQHLLVDLSASGGFLTMGLLYDLLLCGGAVGDDSAATFDGETGAWDLLPGRRLRSYDLLVEYECFIPEDDELVDSGPEAEGSAILYVRGGTVEVDDQDRRFEEPDDDDVGWVPQMLGDMPRIRLANIS